MSLDARRTKDLLQKYHVRPNKKAGQNFLVNPNIARKIVGFASLTKEDTVLEIGGGLGAISSHLAEAAGHVVIIEVDRRLVDALTDILGDHENVTILHGDALRVNLPAVTKVVSNLPYSISSEVTFRLLREVEFDLAILMYQQEFAERLIAQPCNRNYSRLTVNFRYRAHAEVLMRVAANEFVPVPEVDSLVVAVTKRMEGPFARDTNLFEAMVRGVFAYPNKQVGKALRIWFKRKGVAKHLAEEVIKNTEGVEPTDRLRCMGLQELIDLADTMLSMIEAGEIQELRGRHNEV